MGDTVQRVILVDDEPLILRACSQTLELAGVEVQAFETAEQALALAGRDFEGIVVTDVRLPGMDGLTLLARLRLVDPELPVVLITGHSDVAMAVQAMREGAYDFIPKPFASAHLVDVVRRALDKRRLVTENRRLRLALAQEHAVGGLLLGQHPRMAAVRRLIHDVAGSGTDVLVLGETGTGKELVARALHAAGGHAGQPFVAVNAAAVPESMFESEMFGHEAGAFTGAGKRRIGKLEHAGRGTLFLDELESMPMALQAKLLRVLQERVLERLGGNDPVPLHCRVVGATKEDLFEMARAGRFRADLLYRLNVVTVTLPPLRERREDIPLLFDHYVQQAAARFQRPAPPVAAAVYRRLLAHDWPGNVRELKNAAERYALGIYEHEAATPGADSLPALVERFERQLVQEALRTAGSVSQAAEHLGIPRKTLYDKLKRLGLETQAAP
jgi:two-component system C4-dicarboxylate transport response regulator DctD